jgi:PAS domain S-box-containing protein
MRFFVFIGVAAVVAYLSEHLYEDRNALLESERKLRTLFETMLEGFAYCRMIYDAEGKPIDWVYLEVNGAFGRLTGLKDITGKRVLEAIPDIRTLTPELFDTYGRVASTGKPETFEIDFKPLKIWLKVSVFSPAKGEFIAVFEDITDFRRTEEEHLRLAAIVEFSDDAIIGKTLDGTITSWNAGARKLYGYAAEEVTGRPVSLLLPPGEYDDIGEILEKIRSGVTVSHLETKRRTKDGRIIDVSLTISPIKDTKGNVLGASTIARDITGRKRAEEALLESEKRYRDMFELNNAVMFIVNPGTGRIVDANTAASRYYGYSREELSDMAITDINIADPEITMKNMSHAAKNNGEIFYFQHRKKSGEIRDVEVFSAPITLGDNRLLHSIVHDVTERQRAEEALKQANTKLNLLSSITRHDIRNQIFALKAYLELSRETLSDTAKTSEYIIKEERAVNAMERQITFTKEYQDLGVASPVWESVEECVRSALAALPMRDIQVAAEVSDLDVFADPLFERVFYNLIDNALRYGGQKMTAIRITARESKKGLVISVEDNGEGISSEDKKRLFERGFGHHTGLGLFLSREILAITGITITETGEPGTGARFEILVPKGGYRFGITGNPQG